MSVAQSSVPSQTPRVPDAPASGAGARSRPAVRQPLAAAALVVAAGVALPAVLSTYWLDAVALSAIYAMVGLSLGLLFGRVGMISLCQIQMVGLGAWFGLRIGYATALPFGLVVLAAGLCTVAVGLLIGLPALRLSGLHLAIVTLMAAAVITLVLTNVNFPNGGHGLLGYSSSDFTTPRIARPALGRGNDGYFRYVLGVAALVFGLTWWHLRGRVGRGWAAIRESESAALAAGVNVNAYKLWAFALAALVAGIAGALVAGDAGVTVTQFPTQDSITLLAVVLMAGAYSLWGAVVVGLLLQLAPAAFTTWGIDPDVLQILFGLGVVQVLLQSPTGLAGQLPRDLRRLRRAARRRVRGVSGA